MEEQREVVVDRIKEHQMRVKILFDKKTIKRSYQVVALVLIWDKQREPKGIYGKFDSLLKGPFQIKEAYGENSFYLTYLDGTLLPIPYSEKHLKLYNQWGSFPFTLYIG